MFETLKMRLGKEAVLALYNIIGSAILLAIVIASYLVQNILNSGLLLGGWDTPFYAWHARTVIQYGPLYFVKLISYPQLYTQLVAFFGYLSGSVILVQRVLPIVLGALQIMLYALISYRISQNVHVAGLTAILAPVAVGTLWQVSEYHRNQMAYVLSLLVVVLVSKSSAITKRRYILISLLFLTIAATHFETFVILSLTLVLTAFIIKDWKKLVMTLFSSILALGILLLAFPDFLDKYYLNPVQQAYVAKINLGYGDLVFWSIGSWLLLPIAFFGLFGLYRSARHEKNRHISLSIFVLSVLLLGLSLVLIQTDFERVAIRSILLLPVPIILALGIEQIIQFVKRLSIKIRLEGAKKRILLMKGKGRVGSVIAILLSAMVFLSLTYTSIEAMKIIMVPLLRVSGYWKIVEVRQYLEDKKLEAPIFMFHGSSLWSADEYRAYIGIEIGEHLAYFGDLENLIELKPTEPTFPSPEREIATFTSVKYLQDMLGNKNYLVYPHKTFVRNVSDLRLRPLVFIVPELYDAPVPFYLKKFQVADGIYVVPSLADIEDMMTPRLRLETESGVTEVKGSVINGSIV